MSAEHQNAFKKFLMICEQRRIMPLPLLNKVQKSGSYTSLSLEDYSVNSGQIQALSEVIGLFASGSITKVYLNNNGI